MNVLLSIGHGYSARALSRRLLAEGGWRVIGTTRTEASARELEALGVEPLIWPGSDLAPALAAASHVLSSVAPDGSGGSAPAAAGRDSADRGPAGARHAEADGTDTGSAAGHSPGRNGSGPRVFGPGDLGAGQLGQGRSGDPVLRGLGRALAAARPGWLGYLSTTGVYGDHGGGWVDETTPLTPATQRGAWRVAAERDWQALAASAGLPLHIFRLAGIYGPGRGPFEKLREGRARRIIRPGQVFSRIHVEDIAGALFASMTAGGPGRVINLCDDDPAPPEAVILEAARLLGLPPPPEEDFASAEMTPMARSFYAESKRVRNGRMKALPGFALRYPDYRAGLRALLESGAA